MVMVHCIMAADCHCLCYYNKTHRIEWHPYIIYVYTDAKRRNEIILLRRENNKIKNSI